MRTDCIIEDKELGLLPVHVNPRARRITFTPKADAIHVTVPPGLLRSELLRALDRLRPRLLEARTRRQRPPIDLSYRIDAECLRLSLAAGTLPHFLSRSKPGEVEIICPPDTDFTNPTVQALLRKTIMEVLRQQAKLFLPERLALLAQQHGLAYRQVKISTSKGRWGSCSATQNINLSCYLMLLPLHLIDYILLHELSHTREMNHGPAFHTLLNRLTGGRERSLSEELKQYKTEI